MEDGPSAFHSLPQSRKDAALQGLVNVATEGISVATELERIRDTASALDVIKLFTPEASQRLIFGSKGAPAQMRSASFGPAYESFEDMGKGMQSRLTTAMSTVAIKIAETLFLQDAPALLHAMVKQPHFRDFALPQSLIDDSNGYAEFARNKAVLAVVSAVSKMTPYDPERTQLLSLLSDYPRTWMWRRMEWRRMRGRHGRRSAPQYVRWHAQSQRQSQSSKWATRLSTCGTGSGSWELCGKSASLFVRFVLMMEKLGGVRSQLTTGGGSSSRIAEYRIQRSMCDTSEHALLTPNVVSDLRSLI